MNKKNSKLVAALIAAAIALLIAAPVMATTTAASAQMWNEPEVKAWAAAPKPATDGGTAKLAAKATADELPVRTVQIAQPQASQPYPLAAPVLERTSYTPNPQTEYARYFLGLCAGQTWLISEIERLLNMEQKTLDAVTGAGDFSNIRAIGLRDMGVSGTIPVAIGELTELRYLWLSGNRLTGTLPDELFALTKLVEVDLSGNRYEGSIPDGFGTMQSLKHLTLVGNGFTGTIPESILGNTRITLLHLEGNRLGTGRGLPDGIGRMAGLESLNLSGNPWGSGSMPDLTGLENLLSLSLWGCGMTGQIHASVFTLDKLQILDLSGNGLSGEIPEAIGGLGSLEYLSLSGNGLTGTVVVLLSSEKGTTKLIENGATHIVHYIDLVTSKKVYI